MSILQVEDKPFHSEERDTQFPMNPKAHSICFHPPPQRGLNDKKSILHFKVLIRGKSASHFLLTEERIQQRESFSIFKHLNRKINLKCKQGCKYPTIIVSFQIQGKLDCCLYIEKTGNGSCVENWKRRLGTRSVPAPQQTPFSSPQLLHSLNTISSTCFPCIGESALRWILTGGGWGEWKYMRWRKW